MSFFKALTSNLTNISVHIQLLMLCGFEKIQKKLFKFLFFRYFKDVCCTVIPLTVQHTYNDQGN